MSRHRLDGLGVVITRPRPAAEALAVALAQEGALPFVFPALALSYLGQGAFILAHPDATSLHNPFFMMCPPSLFLPLVILATLATIIASQAVISGTYSLAHQALQSGLFPRLALRHISAT